VEKEETFELPAAARDRFLMEIAIEAPDDRELQRTPHVRSALPRCHGARGRAARRVAPRTSIWSASQRSSSDNVRATETLQNYAVNLCRATVAPCSYGVELDGVETESLMQAGISPRGSSMLLRAARVAAWLDGRDMLVPEDLHSVFLETVAHRIYFRPMYELRRGELAPALVRAILARVPVP
jgi:MoxR-like ATPase